MSLPPVTLTPTPPPPPPRLTFADGDTLPLPAATDVAALALQASASGHVADWQRACIACPRDGETRVHQPLPRCVVRGSTYVPACACVHVAAVAGLLWLRLALAYQNEGDDCSCSSAVTNSMRTCASASIACRCLDASLAHYSSYNKRTASSSSSSSSSSTVPLGGSLPAALITARRVFARHAPQGHAGDTYALPAGVGVWSPFEQQWLGGGAAAEAALHKVRVVAWVEWGGEGGACG